MSSFHHTPQNSGIIRRVSDRFRVPFRYFLLVLATAFLANRLLLKAANPPKSPHTNDIHQRLQETISTNHLLKQQLDEIFILTMPLTHQGTDPSSNQQVLLESWLRFDEHFLNRVRHEPSSVFVRASVHFRRGLANQLLSRHEHALQEFRTAIELLDGLHKKYSSVPCYTGDLLRINVYAARSATKLGLPVSIILKHFDAALELINHPSLAQDEELPALATMLRRESASLRQANPS